MKLSKSQLFWKYHIEQCESSSLSKAQYCKQHGINKSSLSAQKSWFKQHGLLETKNPKSDFINLTDNQTNKFQISLSNGILLTFDQLPQASWIAQLIGQMNDPQPEKI